MENLESNKKARQTGQSAGVGYNDGGVVFGACVIIWAVDKTSRPHIWSEFVQIVNRATFLSLPEGVVFSKYEPAFFSELCIKGATLANDYYYQDMLPWPSGVQDSMQWLDALDKAVAGTPTATLDYDVQQRDGCFDEDQLFAVLDERDVDALIIRLIEAKTDAFGQRAPV